MIEYSSSVAPQQKDFLVRTREEMLRKHASGRYVKTDLAGIWQNRVKKASEAYNETKIICTEHEEVDPTFPDWLTYRDNFILDWMSNRVIVTEEEADAMFDKTVEDALAQIESAEGEPGDVTVNTVTTPVVATSKAPAEQTEEATNVVPLKRRGRPPGSAKKTVKAKGGTNTGEKLKRAAAAKKGGSKSAQAQVLIERFQTRDWSRKDILVKIQEQLTIGAAYASTLYQKFAK